MEPAKPVIGSYAKGFRPPVLTRTDSHAVNTINSSPYIWKDGKTITTFKPTPSSLYHRCEAKSDDCWKVYEDDDTRCGSDITSIYMNKPKE